MCASFWQRAILPAMIIHCPDKDLVYYGSPWSWRLLKCLPADDSVHASLVWKWHEDDDRCGCGRNSSDALLQSHVSDSYSSKPRLQRAKSRRRAQACGHLVWFMERQCFLLSAHPPPPPPHPSFPSLLWASHLFKYTILSSLADQLRYIYIYKVDRIHFNHPRSKDLIS